MESRDDAPLVWLDKMGASTHISGEGTLGRCSVHRQLIRNVSHLHLGLHPRLRKSTGGQWRICSKRPRRIIYSSSWTLGERQRVKPEGDNEAHRAATHSTPKSPRHFPPSRSVFYHGVSPAVFLQDTSHCHLMSFNAANPLGFISAQFTKIMIALEGHRQCSLTPA